MRLFDTNTRRIVISRYYSPTTPKFNYNHEAFLKKELALLPVTTIATLNKCNDSIAIDLLFAKLEETSFAVYLPQEPEHNISDNAPHVYPIIVAPKPITQTRVISTVKKGYNKALKDINASVSPSNIIREFHRKQIKPKEVNLTTNVRDDKDVLLSGLVPVINAMSNPEERDKWRDAMAEDFSSPVSKNTGTLVSAPLNEKIIGDMWNLTCKKNEFGETTRYKARWVCFGNHQEHMVNYFHTYSLVARDESLDILLFLAINRD
ncbi:hypothetical protein O181_013386 [Austropuccinia psidii MF-1]|uniref:Reverse transcriptase Ty1/copia-type domain-containing protein n=1 Tax=Austropuccinia psidii MF-1 TaxID=1389203 RepID=A0A9Q3BWB3_9BASI|nr:hypothetical protein [Austropuccinia psidii MF-1]